MNKCRFLLQWWERTLHRDGGGACLFGGHARARPAAREHQRIFGIAPSRAVFVPHQHPAFACQQTESLRWHVARAKTPQSGNPDFPTSRSTPARMLIHINYTTYYILLYYISTYCPHTCWAQMSAHKAEGLPFKKKKTGRGVKAGDAARPAASPSAPQPAAGPPAGTPGRPASPPRGAGSPGWGWPPTHPPVARATAPKMPPAAIAGHPPSRRETVRW